MHVFVHAEPYFRIMHLKEKMPDSSEAKIIERMRAVDKTRRKYCSYYTNTEFGVADFYDLCLSSSTLGVDTCVDIICQLAGKNMKILVIEDDSGLNRGLAFALSQEG